MQRATREGERPVTDSVPPRAADTQATLFAKAALLAQADPTATLQVYAPAPYYMHYPYQANVTVVPTATGATRLGAVWAGNAAATDPSAFEIVTRPNNPNGA